jgi:hypothetical protein
LGHAAGVYTDEEVGDLEIKLQRAIFLLVALLSHLAGLPLAPPLSLHS